MGKEKPHQLVAENFSTYELALTVEKVIPKDDISINNPGNNKEWLESDKQKLSNSNSVLNNIDIIFEASYRKQNQTNYKFKLFSEFFTKKPIIHFDSAGRAHRNPTSLSGGSIDTPHFNRLNENGINFAYKTPELINDRTKDILVNDMNLGLAHFCNEVNIITKKYSMNNSLEKYPSIIFQTSFIPDQQDPLGGVDFV